MINSIKAAAAMHTVRQPLAEDPTRFPDLQMQMTTTWNSISRTDAMKKKKKKKKKNFAQREN